MGSLVENTTFELARFIHYLEVNYKNLLSHFETLLSLAHLGLEPGYPRQQLPSLHLGV